MPKGSSAIPTALLEWAPMSGQLIAQAIAKLDLPPGVFQLLHGDGMTGAGVHSSHAYTSPATYVVTLCVTDDGGANSCCATTAYIMEPGGIADPLPGSAGSAQLRLEQNVPNPFNPRTCIGFEIMEGGATELGIWDTRGVLVWSRSWSHLPPGRHELEWRGTRNDGRQLPWLLLLPIDN